MTYVLLVGACVVVMTVAAILAVVLEAVRQQTPFRGGSSSHKGR